MPALSTSTSTSTSTTKPDVDDAKGFAAFDLDPRLLRAIVELGYDHPTLIQAEAIPLALQGKDILARARTGSGKTVAYCLPILQKILVMKESLDTSSPEYAAIRALILVPTRELAEQVNNVVKQLTMYCSKEIRSVNIALGDAPIQQQRPLLAEKPDIVVSTPSRIFTHIEQGFVDLRDSVECIVLDEADLLLSYGYKEDIESLLPHLPRTSQHFLMSATLPASVKNLKSLVLRNPAILQLQENTETDLLTQYTVKINDDFEKFLLTYFMLKLKVHPFGTGKILVFVKDVDRCFRLKLFLEQFGIRSCVLNSELPVKSRYHIVQEFNRGVYDILIATDEGDKLGRHDEDTDSEKEEEEEEDEVTKELESEAKEIEESEPKRKSVTLKETAKKPKRRPDAEYGISRGIDFQNVQSVLNFDFPTTSRNYMHRVGRTARGVGNKGWAISFVMEEDESVLERVDKKQSAMSRELKPYAFNDSHLSSFKYRCQDALRSVTRVAIKEARVKELTNEILTSEKLKSHFENNPADLRALRHDKPLHPARVQPHLKHVPKYLLPKAGANLGSENGEAVSTGIRADSKKRRRNFNQNRNQKNKMRKMDPLKSFRK